VKAGILYIEDNEQNLYLVTFILGAKGYRVLQARNGVEGIQMAIQHKPEMILLDIQLPGMDGYAVARGLRAHPDVPAATPILALTSYAMPGDKEKALAAGCSGYIVKPIDPDTFLAEVEQHLSEPRPSEGALR
jgi:two-component system cell cycle response regulator DivK